MKQRRTISAARLPLTGWTRIDVAGIWAAELFPLLDGSKALQAELEEAMAGWVVRPAAPWVYGPDAEPPVMFTEFDAAVTYVDEAISRAADHGDPEAVLHKNLTMIGCLAEELRIPIPGAVAAWIGGTAAGIYRRFQPQRAVDAGWVRPIGSCHYWSSFAHALAAMWDPNTDWRVVKSKTHTTVIDLKGMRVFEIVLIGRDISGDGIIAFAKGLETSSFLQELAECAKRIDEVHAKYRASAKPGAPAVPPTTGG